MSEDNNSFKNIRSIVHDERELLERLESLQDEDAYICYVYGKNLFAIFKNIGSENELFFSDINNNGLKMLKKLAKKGVLKYCEVDHDQLKRLKYSDPSWELQNADLRNIDILTEYRRSVFGRGKNISSKTRQKVWSDAGARCMYSGCGKDLSCVSISTKNGQTAYLAHIVASSPNGPRGGKKSHKLSDDPENIMLMCDDHHQLIDRIDAESELHTEQSLKNMRAKHVRQVKYLLDSLKYPRTKMITILANLAEIPVNNSENDLKAAVIARNLMPVDSAEHEIYRTQRDKRTDPFFWNQLLDEHERDIVQFQRNITHIIREHVVAIYPLHLTPILVLAGRIVGEAGRVEVFQYHREQNSWQWDTAATPHPENSLELLNCQEQEKSGKEVLLSLELTSYVDEAVLPADLKESLAQGRLTWVRLRHTTPSTASIRHPDDLQHFREKAREAVALVQDKLRAPKVHLIAVSPASTIFRFGQLLQPGHHPPYIVYDRPNGNVPFNPALCIVGDRVTATDRNDPDKTREIQLR